MVIQPFDQDEPVEEAILTSHRPIDPKREDKWVEAYAKALKKFDLPEDPNTAEDADLITGAILEAMSTATIKTMPDGNKKRKVTDRRDPHGGTPSNRTREHFAQRYAAPSDARRSHGDRILAEIRTSKVFESLKWFQGKRRNQGHDQRPFQEISTDEIANAIKCTSNKSSPGAFGSNYRLLKWAFWCNTSIFVNLFNLCLRIGYHPSVLRNCVIAHPKARRQDITTQKLSSHRSTRDAIQTSREGYHNSNHL
ncbi:hypothetical protein RhiXN_01705 [Rhizoctonia solani]|uniref:Uncharacterized protein n=1 Tax=Rhizoctonia solani TaxID=456999 RepID=A0A8H8P8F7_9AGAM|nr:uncharacterized protein RhiXN_01705 [Rhizoctonia solani]QRW27110.1 hypothetical protein RhiXN_01705 [Rhizoctonia solani]